MWTIIRSPKLRNARHILATIKHRSNLNRCSSFHHIHLLQTHFNLPGPIPKNRFSSSTFRVWPHTPDLRLRLKLPHSEIPTITERGGSECDYIHGCVGVASVLELGGCVQSRAWAFGGVVGVELVVVGHCDCAVCVYSEE